MALTTAQRTINERTTFVYTATLQDEDSNALALASVDSMTLTLYDVESGTIINSRDGQDVLNTNQVTLHATSGLLTWTALAADAAIVGAPEAGYTEHHVALFEVTYSTTKTITHEVSLYVQQITNSP